jgi:tetratricopeptide (TPR) repeat protein
MRALAQAYQSAGRPAQQIEPLYLRALALQPALAWIRADYADFLAAQGRNADAEEAFRAVIAEEPSRAVAWFNFGVLLAQERKLAGASGAFHQAVTLDPSLSEALTPLVQVTVQGTTVDQVDAMQSPLPALAQRDRGPDAFRLTVADPRHVAFLNTTPKSYVLILKPGGSLLLALPTGEGGALRWDLRSASKEPLPPGLYQAELRGRDASGKPTRPQSVYIGLVRQPSR